VAKKAKKVVRREYTKADVRESRVHSKAKTPVSKVSTLTKRSEGSLRQKLVKPGIRLGIVGRKRPEEVEPTTPAATTKTKINEPQPKNIQRADLVPANGYSLVVDGHFKTLFEGEGAAQKAAKEVLANYPMLKVEIYDASKKQRTLVK
jgi:hypothetical protein